MSLRIKTLICLSGVLSLYLAFDLFLYQHRILPGFVELERAQALQNYDRCIKAIDREHHLLSRTCRDWSWWTDTWNYALNPDKEYEDENLVVSTFQNFDLAAFYIYNSHGEKAWGHSYNPDTEEYGVFEDFEQPLSQSIIDMLNIVKVDVAVSGWVHTSRGPVLFASSVILNSEGEGESHGQLVMARLIDEKFAFTLSAQTELTVTIQSGVSQDHTPHDPIIGYPDDTTMTVTGCYPDITGKNMMKVSATMPRTIMPVGERVVDRSIHSDLIAGALLSICLIILLEIFILRPITRLNESIAKIAAKGDHHQRLPQPRGDGEIQHLTRKINEMLAALEEDEHERQKLEAELWQRRKKDSLDTMAKSIAHSFNNLLGSALGYQELLLKHLQSDHKATLWLQTANNAVHRAADLSTLMLSYIGFKIRAQHPTDLNEACKDQLSQLADQIPDRITIKLELADELPEIALDPKSFKQALSNIVINAVEAIDQEGTISISTGTTFRKQCEGDASWLFEGPMIDQYIQVDITDNGHGMSETIRQRAFDPFTSSKFVGRGLGLATVLGFIRSHSGAVRITSQEGKGTCVSMLLPLLPIPALVDFQLDPI